MGREADGQTTGNRRAVKRHTTKKPNASKAKAQSREELLQKALELGEALACERICGNLCATTAKIEKLKKELEEIRTDFWGYRTNAIFEITRLSKEEPR